jgi:RND family efflux transporter MFP subunit
VDGLFRLVLTNAAWATALILAATVGAWLCRRRPAIVHVLWLLVLVKLVTPSLTQVGLPAGAAVSLPAGGRGSARAGQTKGRIGGGVMRPAPSAVMRPAPSPVMRPAPSPVMRPAPSAVMRPAPSAVMRPAPSAGTSGGRGSVRAGESNGDGQTTPGHTVQGPTPKFAQRPLVAARARNWPWRPALVLLWLAGAAAWWAIVGLSTCRFRRLAQSARPAPTELTDRANQVAARLGLNHVPPIALVPARVPPMLWASLAGRPRLILPEQLWARFDGDQQDAVLAHELAHWKRRDHWVRRLEAIVLGLYWWYPGAWWARRQLERAEEECCDAWVVWALPSAASSYAEALLATAVFLSGVRQRLPVGASGAASTLPLKRRLNMILHDQSTGSIVRSAPRFVLVAGALALPFLPAPAPGQQAGPPGSVAPASAQPAALPAEVTTSPVKTDGKATEAGFVVTFKEFALDPKKPDEKVRVCQPIVREVSDYMHYAGQLEAAHTVRLRARVSGMIVNANCRLGETVKANDLLFKIDPRSYQAELDKAEAEVRRAKSRMKRCQIKLANVKSLFENKLQIVSQNEVFVFESEVVESEAAVGSATADRDLAKLKLDSTEVRSPIAGAVSGSVLDAGSVVTADSTDLTTIVALDPMYVVFNLDEATALRLKRENKNQANAASAPLVTVGLIGEAVTARNAQFSLADMHMHGQVRCRAAISNQDGFLFPGLSATVRVTTSAPHRVFLVPGNAVARVQGEGAHVYFLNQKNTVERRPIKVGSVYDGLRVVTEGLSAGDWVIADPPTQGGLQ